MAINKIPQASNIFSSLNAAVNSTTLDFNINIFTSKKYYIHQFVSKIRTNGGDEFWVLNKTHLEIYRFKAIQITEFDVQIDLFNELEKDKVFSGIFVLHRKEHILKILNEVPGSIYTKKLECYRDLYTSLYKKASTTKVKNAKIELAEKIEFIETEFPQFVI